MPTMEEEQGVYEEDDELDDSEGDDSDMEEDDDDDDDDEEEFSGVPPIQRSQPSLLPREEPNSSFTFLNPNPNPNHTSAPSPIAPQKGTIAAVPIAVGDVFSSPAGHALSGAEESRRVASADDSRRLFQRLWTDEDEITILQGFLEFTTQRGTTHASHQYDTGPFYEQIKKRLQLEFNKNQLIEKLRRLKKKYRNVVNRMVSGKEFSFKSAHEQATFEISRKIWSASIKRARDSEDDEFTPNPVSAIVEFDPGHAIGAVSDGIAIERRLSKSSRRRIRRTVEQEAAAAAAAAAAVAAVTAAAGAAVEVPIAAPPDPPLTAPIPSIIEETVKSCLSPLFKELLQSSMAAGSQGGIIPGIGGIGVGGILGANGLQLGIGNVLGNLPSDEKWRNQNILELEVYLKRIDLMRDHIKLILEELKSSTPTAGG